MNSDHDNTSGESSNQGNDGPLSNPYSVDSHIVESEAFDPRPIDPNHPNYVDPHGNDSTSKKQDAEPDAYETNTAGFLINGLCGLIIISLVAFIFLAQRSQSKASGVVSPQADLAEFSFQAKVLLGIKVIGEGNPLMEEQQGEAQLNLGYFGSVRMRQAGAVMVSELKSKEDALVVLSELENKAKELGYEFSEAETRTNGLLKTLFQDSVAALTPIEKKHLQEELLWFGDLALHPEPEKPQTKTDSERDRILEGVESTTLTFAGLMIAAIVALLVGAIGFIFMMVIYLDKKLICRTKNNSKEPSIYLESFTVWLVTFVLFSFILGAIAPESNPLVSNVIVFLSSLTAGLLWAVLRGKSGEQLRTDIGFCGNPITEIPMAIWSYLCALPLVAIGLITSTVLLVNYSPQTPDGLGSSRPTHPILEWVMSGDAVTIGLVFFVACFCAPLVEETMFRGFLYRSLRDRSHRMGHFASATLSALGNGLLFAAIHPQGLMFIPSLCALGMGFSFAREWRGTLWTPIWMHALHNGILTFTLVFVFSA